MPISFEFQESYKLYFLNLDARSPAYPQISSEYDFGKLPYPAVFSVSMTVDNSKKDSQFSVTLLHPAYSSSCLLNTLSLACDRGVS